MTNPQELAAGLTEKVARGICAENGGVPDKHWRLYTDDAQAAIAIVLEAAAKAAWGAQIDNPLRNLSKGQMQLFRLGKDCAATAIRALNPGATHD